MVATTQRSHSRNLNPQCSRSWGNNKSPDSINDTTSRCKDEKSMRNTMQNMLHDNDWTQPADFTRSIMISERMCIHFSARCHVGQRNPFACPAAKPRTDYCALWRNCTFQPMRGFTCLERVYFFTVNHDHPRDGHFAFEEPSSKRFSRSIQNTAVKNMPRVWTRDFRDITVRSPTALRNNSLHMSLCEVTLPVTEWFFGFGNRKDGVWCSAQTGKCVVRVVYTPLEVRLTYSCHHDKEFHPCESGTQKVKKS